METMADAPRFPGRRIARVIGRLAYKAIRSSMLDRYGELISSALLLGQASIRVYGTCKEVLSVY